MRIRWPSGTDIVARRRNICFKGPLTYFTKNVTSTTFVFGTHIAKCRLNYVKWWGTQTPDDREANVFCVGSDARARVLSITYKLVYDGYLSYYWKIGNRKCPVEHQTRRERPDIGTWPAVFSRQFSISKSRNFDHRMTIESRAFGSTCLPSRSPAIMPSSIQRQEWYTKLHIYVYKPFAKHITPVFASLAFPYFHRLD